MLLSIQLWITFPGIIVYRLNEQKSSNGHSAVSRQGNGKRNLASSRMECLKENQPPAKLLTTGAVAAAEPSFENMRVAETAQSMNGLG